MPTLEELRRENQRLRNVQKSLGEIKDIQDERMKLLRENKSLSRNIKHGKAISVGKSMGRTVKRGITSAGKGALRGIRRYANFLEKQEMRQRAVNRNLKSIKRKRKTIKSKPIKRKKKTIITSPNNYIHLFFANWVVCFILIILLPY